MFTKESFASENFENLCVSVLLRFICKQNGRIIQLQVRNFEVLVRVGSHSPDFKRASVQPTASECARWQVGVLDVAQ